MKPTILLAITLLTSCGRNTSVLYPFNRGNDNTQINNITPQETMCRQRIRRFGCTLHRLDYRCNQIYNECIHTGRITRY